LIGKLADLNVVFESWLERRWRMRHGATVRAILPKRA